MISTRRQGGTLSPSDGLDNPLEKEPVYGKAIGRAFSLSSIRIPCRQDCRVLRRQSKKLMWLTVSKLEVVPCRHVCLRFGFETFLE
jgi:hypothetical protein